MESQRTGEWIPVSYPISELDHLPAERKTVLVWLASSHLPYCGYIRYSAGDITCPYFVVYHGNDQKGTDVIAWCDCLPSNGPQWLPSGVYASGFPNGRGYPERKPAVVQFAGAE